jgi:leucyl-tRNA synthetase
MASGQFDGMPAAEAIPAILAWLAARGAATPKVQYRLHDWCISRQRYWGPPIPVLYCDACGTVPVPEEDLPVLLPPIDDFRPDDTGVSPLARHEEWYYVDCPSCGGRARRETDVSDTFLDSSWYFLRYPSSGRDDVAFEPGLTRRWLPVNSYIGGNEHAVLHLLYSRFITMVLHEQGLLDFEEPFTRFRAHGLIVKDGAKMSKSRGNVVVPDEYIEQWGADTFRMYLMFLGPFLEGGDFRDAGISGIRRFLDKVWALVGETAGDDGAAMAAPVRTKWHQTIHKVTEDTESLHYNTAIAAMMELVNVLREYRQAPRPAVRDLVLLLAPFAPHFAEECWQRLGETPSVFDAAWPVHDPAALVEDEVEVVIQVNGKTRSRVTVARDAGEEAVVRAALDDDTVQRFVEGQQVRKRILVPNRLLNLVLG